MVMDEVRARLKIVHRTTQAREKNPVIPTSGMWDGGRVTIMGAMGDDGLNYFDFCNTGNWDNTKMFLLRMYAEFGRALIFMDNASYHIAGELKKITYQTNGEMQFRFLPKYTPELARSRSSRSPARAGFTAPAKRRRAPCKGPEGGHKPGHGGDRQNARMLHSKPVILPAPVVRAHAARGQAEPHRRGTYTQAINAPPAAHRRAPAPCMIHDADFHGN